jgi:Family of unknown function (DUF6535)
MEYYFQQNNALLDQISRQISFIAPQISIPSNPPTPFPDFKPSRSDIRVNVFWFMALVLGLLAASIAMFFQQWVGDYMYGFRRFSDPVNRAQARQYLHEASQRWYLPAVGNVVPGILQMSLFLYFVGLCDFVLNINTEVGMSTTIPITIASLLYIFTTVAPVIDPQWPYRNSFSALIWYVHKKVSGHPHKDRDPIVTSNSMRLDMAEEQIQRAMAATNNRKGRVERVLRWLVFNATEGAGMEALVMAIPDSFDEKSGMDMWRKVIQDRNTVRSVTNESGPSRMQRIFNSFIPMVQSRAASNSHANTAVLPLVHHSPGFYSHSASSYTQGEDTLLELSARLGRLLDTCKNKGHFASDQEWRRRTRACVETTASLVCLIGAELDQFGDMVRLLGDIGSDQTVRKSSLAGKEQPFVMRWTCLSLVVIRPILKSESLLRNDAKQAWQQLEQKYSAGPEQSPTRLEKIIETFNQASKCLKSFSGLPIAEGNETEVKAILRRHESRILELEQIVAESAWFHLDEWSISSVEQSIDRITHGIITRQLPGVKSDVSNTESIYFGQFVELFRHPHTMLFIFPWRNLRRIRSFTKTLREILEGEKDGDTFWESIKDLGEFLSTWSVKLDHPDKLFRRQLWRLQDLDGGGLGFTVELFFLALKRLLSTPPSKESHSELYIGTFRAITARASDYRAPPGTQKLLLDMVVPYRGIIFDVDYPDKVVTEFLKFLGSILEEHTGDRHIDEVVEQLRNATRDAMKPRHRALATEALVALGFIQAGPSSS